MQFFGLEGVPVLGIIVALAQALILGFSRPSRGRIRCKTKIIKVTSPPTNNVCLQFQGRYIDKIELAHTVFFEVSQTWY